MIEINDTLKSVHCTKQQQQQKRVDILLGNDIKLLIKCSCFNFIFYFIFFFIWETFSLKTDWELIFCWYFKS